MKLHPFLKKILTHSSFCATFTLMAGSLVFPAHAESFTVDGIETEWAPVNNEITINDAANADTVIKVDGKQAASTTLYAGLAQNTDVSGNALEVSNSEFKNVQAARIIGNGNATQNSVKLENTKVTSTMYVANVRGNGEASGNTLSVSGGSVGHLAGGLVVQDGKTNNNNITVNNATVTGQVMGGYMYANNGTSTALNNEASGNSVTVTNSQTGSNTIVGAYLLGNGQANGNSVTLDGSTTDRQVFGAHLTGTEAGSETNAATGNSLTITNGSTANNGAVAAYITNGNVSHNTITIKGSTVTGDVVAGLVYAGSGNATNNTLILENATVSGGCCRAAWTGGGDATHNTVILKGNSQVNGELMGGYDSKRGYDVITGNSLTMEAFTGYVSSVANFDTIEQTGGSATIGNGSLKAATSVSIHGTEDAAATLSSGTSALTVSAGQNVNISNATLSATGKVTLSSEGSVALNNAAVSGSDVAISGNVSLGGGTVAGIKSVTIRGNEGAASPASDSGVAEGDLSISGGTSVDISGVALAQEGEVTISGGGSVALKDMSISGSNVTISGTGAASSRTLENVAITVAAGGTADLRNTTISGSTAVTGFTFMTRSSEAVTVLLDGSTVVLDTANSTVTGENSNYTIDASPFFAGVEVKGSYTLDITALASLLTDFESIAIDFGDTASGIDSASNIYVALGERTYSTSYDATGNTISFGPSDAIPEPATTTLSLLALAGLAARRRRK